MFCCVKKKFRFGKIVGKCKLAAELLVPAISLLAGLIHVEMIPFFFGQFVSFLFSFVHLIE
jgi:hypothetical protein